MVDNAEWLTKLNYIEFLRDVGRHFSVNRMLSFDRVKLRLEREQELSFLEFNYMILQAYDFVELATPLRLHPADGRLGPVGQHRQRHRSRPPHGHAAALRADLRRCITTSSGAKMGKTASGAVWLNARPAAALRLLAVLAQHRGRATSAASCRLFTTLPLDEIARLEALGGAEINEAKKVLATEATALLHGRDGRGARRRDRAQDLRGGRACARALPTVEITARTSSTRGLGVLTAFVPNMPGLVPSTGEARRQVKGGGLRVNDRAVTDERGVLRASTSRRRA